MSRVTDIIIRLQMRASSAQVPNRLSLRNIRNDMVSYAPLSRIEVKESSYCWSLQNGKGNAGCQMLSSNPKFTRNTREQISRSKHAFLALRNCCLPLSCHDLMSKACIKG